MAEKVKYEQKVIQIPEGRASFLKPTASFRTDKFGREIKVDPRTGKALKPKWSMTWLLDPSNAKAAATIKEIQEDALRIVDTVCGGRDKWPPDNQQTGTKGVQFCFGQGNKLPKVYDGYKDMFYIKVADTTEPIFGDRNGRQLRFNPGDGLWHVVDRKTGLTTEETADPALAPYGGAYGRGSISLYWYNNESAGVNANFRSFQFLRPGASFGGGAARSAAEELAEMAGDAPVATAGAPAKDPWD